MHGWAARVLRASFGSWLILHLYHREPMGFWIEPESRTQIGAPNIVYIDPLSDTTLPLYGLKGLKV